MDQKVYVCTGSCGAVVSEEDYKGGITHCGTDGCTCEGASFEERIQCSQCSEVYKKDEEHTH